jgi:hypothetical protein
MKAEDTEELLITPQFFISSILIDGGGLNDMIETTSTSGL